MRFARQERRGLACRADEGFTLIEIVMSLTLFMIIFVGMMTFMQSNIMTSARANSRAKAVNVAASYIEQVRTLQYTDIGTPFGTPPGILQEQNFTQGGLNFHVVPTVQWIDDPTVNGPGGVATSNDFKRIIVTVTASSTSSSSPLAPITYVLESYVSRAGGQSQVTALPTVEFDGSSPVAGQFIGGTVHVGGTGQANAEGAVITNLNMYADDSQKGLLLSPTLQVAQWSNNSPSITRTFQWDTTAVTVDASTGVSTRVFPDGPHNLTLQVFDSLGKSAFTVRSIYIVNTPPTTPNVVLTGSSATTLTGSWNVCYSGTVPADHYEWYLEDQHVSTGAWITQEYAFTGTTTNTVVTLPVPARWDRYRLRVRAYSPVTEANPSGFVGDWGPGFGYNRTRLTSLSYSNVYTGGGTKRWDTTINTPVIGDWTRYFPAAAAPTVQYYKNSTMSTATATPISFPHTFQTPANKNLNPPTPFYYAAKLTFTPSINGGGAPAGPAEVWTNWVGPNSFVSGSNTSTGTMTISGW